MRSSVVLSVAAALAAVVIGSSPEAFAADQYSVRDKSSGGVTVRDHRAVKVASRNDHRATEGVTVRDHRATKVVTVRDHRAQSVGGVSVTARYTPRKKAAAKAAVPYKPMYNPVPSGR